MNVLKQFPRPHLVALIAFTLVFAAVLLVTPEENLDRSESLLSVQPIPVPDTPVSGTEQISPSAQSTLKTVQLTAFQDNPFSATPVRDLVRLAGYTEPATEQEPSTAAAPEPENQLEWQRFTVEPGDSLSRLFRRAGLDDGIMYRVLNGEGKTRELTELKVGKKVEFGFDDNGKLAALVLRNSRTTKLSATRREDGFRTVEHMREPDIELEFAGGEIQTSFALAANRAGLGRVLRNKLSRIFGWEIDFSRDLRKGDRFGVLYEKQYLDGELIGYGRILAASFINQGEEHSAALYTDTNGRSGYYAPDGSSLRKAFLRAPVNYNYISSHFDMHRKHPILNRVRPHEGTDFAASPGTPVRASGDGRVRFIGRDGGYGKTIRIEHGNEVTTVYAHLRSYKRGIRRGKRVQQGDIIGYVGMSGLVTGPHLHYEYRVSDRPRNPLHVSLPDADPVPNKEMTQFRMQTDPLLAKLSDHDESFQIALAEE